MGMSLPRERYDCKSAWRAWQKRGAAAEAVMSGEKVLQEHQRAASGAEKGDLQAKNIPEHQIWHLLKVAA